MCLGVGGKRVLSDAPDTQTHPVLGCLQPPACPVSKVPTKPPTTPSVGVWVILPAATTHRHAHTTPHNTTHPVPPPSPPLPWTPPQGFTDGVMKVGPYAGRKVSEVKPIIREELIAAGQALPYSEPEKQVGG